MRKNGFTLAEVLITLTIIGVIAAITIPNLSRKWSDHADVQKVKEAYSILSNAYRLCIAENGTMETWDWKTPPPNWIANTDNHKLSECMLPYLKVQKYCPGSNDFACWKGPEKYKDFFGNTVNNYMNVNVYGKIKLQNGMYIGTPGLYVDSNGNGTWNNTGAILVDINREKGPNRAGYDIFLFAPTRNGIVSASHRYSTKNDRAINCSNKCTSSFQCGSSCSDWVLNHGNMDYKYRDVSAEW